MNQNPGHLFHPKAAMRRAGLCILAVSMLAGILSAEILPLKVKLGDKAPDFALPSADGQTVRISDYAGHNVLIDFYRGHW